MKKHVSSYVNKTLVVILLSLSAPTGLLAYAPGDVTVKIQSWICTPKDKGSIWQGSGLLFTHKDEFYVVTSSHVIANYGTIYYQYPVCVRGLKGNQSFEATVVVNNALKDLALLKVMSNPTLDNLKKTTLGLGELSDLAQKNRADRTAEVYGYRAVDLDLKDPQFVKILDRRADRRLLDHDHLVEIEGYTEVGMSGAPVFSQEKLLGILSHQILALAEGKEPTPLQADPTSTSQEFESNLKQQPTKILSLVIPFDFVGSWIKKNLDDTRLDAKQNIALSRFRDMNQVVMESIDIDGFSVVSSAGCFVLSPAALPSPGGSPVGSTGGNGSGIGDQGSTDIISHLKNGNCGVSISETLLAAKRHSWPWKDEPGSWDAVKSFVKQGKKRLYSYEAVMPDGRTEQTQSVTKFLSVIKRGGKPKLVERSGISGQTLTASEISFNTLMSYQTYEATVKLRGQFEQIATAPGLTDTLVIASKDLKQAFSTVSANSKWDEKAFILSAVSMLKDEEQRKIYPVTATMARDCMALQESFFKLAYAGTQEEKRKFLGNQFQVLWLNGCQAFVTTLWSEYTEAIRKDVWDNQWTDLYARMSLNASLQLHEDQTLYLGWRSEFDKLSKGFNTVWSTAVKSGSERDLWQRSSVGERMWFLSAVEVGAAENPKNMDAIVALCGTRLLECIVKGPL